MNKDAMSTCKSLCVDLELKDKGNILIQMAENPSDDKGFRCGLSQGSQSWPPLRLSARLQLYPSGTEPVRSLSALSIRT